VEAVGRAAAPGEVDPGAAAQDFFALLPATDTEPNVVEVKAGPEVAADGGAAEPGEEGPGAAAQDFFAFLPAADTETNVAVAGIAGQDAEAEVRAAVPGGVVPGAAAQDFPGPLSSTHALPSDGALS